MKVTRVRVVCNNAVLHHLCFLVGICSQNDANLRDFSGDGDTKYITLRGKAGAAERTERLSDDSGSDMDI